MGTVAEEQMTIDDPRVLRAIAHPIRMRMLDLFDTHGSQRATDIAQALEIPANQASFHLRQLAKYGLVVEAPEEARDGRDRVWKLAHAVVNIDARGLRTTAGGRAALAAFRAHWLPQAYQLIDRVASGEHDEGQLAVGISTPLRLTNAEARELRDELNEIVDRWAHRLARPDDVVEYELLLAIAPPQKKSDD